jgi:F-type H+-transporting ATPase subunit b
MTEEAFYAEPVFWVAVSFAIFALLVCRPLLRFIAKALDSRSAQIAGELAEARRLREEAEATLAVYQKKQQESLAEAKAMLAKTEEDAARMASAAEVELRAVLDKRIKLSMEKIAQAETKALQDVQNHVVDIAIAAARALIQEHLTRGGNEDIIKQAAVELERKLH